MRRNYKKGLAFVLTLLLVLGTFGFAFALGPGVESAIHEGNLNHNVDCTTCQALGLSSEDIILDSGEAGGIPDYLTWNGNGYTSGVLTNIGETDIEINNIVVKAGNEHYVISFTSENNILEADGGTYTIVNQIIMNSQDVAKEISHIIVFGSVCEPKYNLNFNINKEVTILAGSPATKDFTFNVEVNDLEIVEDQTITIPAGSTEGSVSFSISNLEQNKFPFDLIITENEESEGDGWTYDDNEYVVLIGLNEQKQVTYNGSTSTGAVTFVNTYNFTPIPTTPGSIQITKRIRGDEQVSASATQFDFYVYSGATTIGGIVTASALSPATVGNLTPGAYTVKEVNIPAGYIATADTINVTVESGKTETASFVNSYESTPPIPTTPGSIQITKRIRGDEQVSASATQFDFYVYSGATTIGGIVTASALSPATVGNLTPGAYTVKEVNIPAGYIATADTINVTVESGKTETASFVNSYESTPPPPTSKAAITIVKQVASSSAGPWGNSLTINDEDAHVFYRFIVTNTGDYDLENVTIYDSYITTLAIEDDLAVDEIVTTDAIEFDLAEIWEFWDGNTFTNEAEATGWYGDEHSVKDKDTAVVRYSSGSSGGGSNSGNQPATIEEQTTPLVEAPVEIPEIVIPEAEIPKTGGLGIMAFMAIGGIITAAGATLRKK